MELASDDSASQLLAHDKLQQHYADFQKERELNLKEFRNPLAENAQSDRFQTTTNLYELLEQFDPLFSKN